MASSKVISVTFYFAVVFVQVISSQIISQRYPEQMLQPTPQLGPVPSPHMGTECLCKDLASAIQSVVLSKMRQHSPNCPLFKNYAPANLVPNPGNIATNSICDGTSQCQCPICSKKWQNSLARVLGMANYGQNCAGTNNIPYGNTAPQIIGAQGLSSVPNIYSVQEEAKSFDPQALNLNNLANVLMRSLPKSSNKYSDIVLIGGNPNGLNGGYA